MRRHLSCHSSDENCCTSTSNNVDDRLTKDGGKTYFILPAFFECLYELEQSQREYNLVIRTFGSDLPLVADAVEAFAQGKHPLFPSFHSQTLRLPKGNMYRGRYTQSNEEDDESAIYRLHEWTDDVDTEGLGRVVAPNDEQILAILEQDESSTVGNSNYKVFGINDDYHFWSQNKQNPRYGKPVWVHRCCEHLSSPLHIIFDDNIRNDPFDSIVAVRYQDNDESQEGTRYFRALCGKKIQTLQGKHLVRVPTYKPILQRSWFLQQIEQCERNISGCSSFF